MLISVLDMLRTIMFVRLLKFFLRYINWSKCCIFSAIKGCIFFEQTCYSYSALSGSSCDSVCVGLVVFFVLLFVLVLIAVLVFCASKRGSLTSVAPSCCAKSSRRNSYLESTSAPNTTVVQVTGGNSYDDVGGGGGYARPQSILSHEGDPDYLHLDIATKRVDK